eukprot:gene32693-17148_t
MALLDKGGYDEYNVFSLDRQSFLKDSSLPQPLLDTHIMCGRNALMSCTNEDWKTPSGTSRNDALKNQAKKIKCPGFKDAKAEDAAAAANTTEQMAFVPQWFAGSVANLAHGLLTPLDGSRPRLSCYPGPRPPHPSGRIKTQVGALQ